MSLGLIRRQIQNALPQLSSIRCVHALREPSFAIPNKSPRWATTSEDIFKDLSNGSHIFVHGGAMTPSILIKHLVDYATKADLKNLKTYHIHTEGYFPMNDENMSERFRSVSLFTGSNSRKAIVDGRADYVPIFLHEIPILFRKGLVHLDYALLDISPPDRHGFSSLGVSVDVARAACEAADVIVAQVNPEVPVCKGDAEIHISNIDVLVDGPMPLHQLPKRTVTPEETKIAEFIANELVVDGATLQTGIGSIPDAVLNLLTKHKDLGVHTELFSDGLVDLYKTGAVTNSKKKLFPGKIVSSFVIGSKKSFDFADGNPAVDMRDIAWTNNPVNIAQNPRPTAINSCIEVDLTGQIVSDSIGTRIYSGFGGQVDFLRGAAISTDGLGVPIIALASATKKGQSKIVPYLKPGAGVVTTRAHVHYVVTEYGIAYLFGKTLRQRAYELIEIAHPDHREKLEKDAFEILHCMPAAD